MSIPNLMLEDLSRNVGDGHDVWWVGYITVFPILAPSFQVDSSHWVSPDDDSPSGGDQLDDDSALEQGSIDLMDNVINSFRWKEIMKFKALLNILAVLDSNTTKPEKTKDAAVKYYLCTLNEIEALTASAIRRGQQTQWGLQPSTRPSPEAIHAKRQQRDAEIDKLISHVSGESGKSKRPLSGDFFDTNDNANDSNIEGVQSNRKRRVFESQMPWFSWEDEERRTGNEECKESRRLLTLFARDFKAIKLWIENSRTAPLGFPTSEWDNIIQGQAINLDAVLSSLHHISTPKENVGCVGSTEISLGQSELSKRVQTSGKWTSAWNAMMCLQRSRCVWKIQNTPDPVERKPSEYISVAMGGSESVRGSSLAFSKQDRKCRHNS